MLINPPPISFVETFGIGAESVFTPEFLQSFDEEFLEYSLKLAGKGWQFLGEGRHRRVHLSPKRDKVVKISRNVDGVKDNLHELFWASRGDTMQVQEMRSWNPGIVSIPIPKVFGHARVGNLSLLCVEYVKPALDGWELARSMPWIYHVDVDKRPQIGYTAEGRLVCFDWCR